MTECAPSPSVSSLIFGDALVAALLDDVGRAELAGQRLPVGVATDRDDPLGAELLGGQDAEQPDRAVTDDRDGLAGAGLGGDGGEPAGAEDVGGRQQRRDQVGVGLAGGGDQGAVGERDAGVLGLGADRAREDARARSGTGSRPGRSRRCCRRRQNEPTTKSPTLMLLTSAPISSTTPTYSWPIGLVVDGLGAAVGPQVGSADAGRRDPDDRVGRLDDRRVFALLDLNVTGLGHDYLSHGVVLLGRDW